MKRSSATPGGAAVRQPSYRWTNRSGIGPRSNTFPPQLGRDLLAIAVLVLVLCASVVAITRVRPTARNFAIDALPPGVGVESFYGVEENAAGAYRWSKPDARIIIGVDQPATYQIALTLGDAPNAPARREVQIAARGTTLATVALTPTPQVYTFEYRVAPPWGREANWDELQLELHTTSFTPPGDNRTLGVIVTHIAATPLPLTNAALLRLLAPLLAILLSLYGALRAVRLRAVLAGALVGGGLLVAAVVALRDRPQALGVFERLAEHPVGLTLALLALVVGAAAVRYQERLLVWVASASSRALILALPFVLIVPLVQSGLLLGLIWTHTHTVPYIDEWETVKLIRHYRDGELLWRDFWYFHNEHRLVLPRMIHLVLIELTGWNRQIEMTVNLGIVLATGAIFLSSIRRQGGRWAAWALLVPLALILLSFAQYENLLFAFQTNFFLAVFGGACCVWGLLERPTSAAPHRRHFVVAILGALIASLSTLGGLTTWIAFLPVVWRMGKVRVAIWSACAVAIIVPYMQGFSAVVAPARAASSGAILHDPTLVVRFGLAMLGGPLGYPDHVRAQIIALLGIALLLANLIAYRRYRPTGPWLFAWVGLGLYGLACTGLTTLGRSQSGLPQAMISRYQTFSSLAWIATFALVGLTQLQLGQVAAPVPRAVTKLRQINAAALVLAIPALLLANIVGWRDSLHWPAPTLASQDCIIHYQTAPDSCIDPYFPSGTWFVRIQAAYLDREHLAAFKGHPQQVITPPADPPPGLAPGAYDPASLRLMADSTALIVDGLGDLSDSWADPKPLTLAAGSPLTLTGWAVDVLSFVPARGAYITVDGGQPFKADFGFERYDASRLLGHEYANSGYSVTIPASALPPGKHTLKIHIVTADGRAYYTPLHTMQLTVR